MVKKSHESNSMNYGITIRLLKSRKVIEETLTRIGICNKKTKKITPSCYIKVSKNNIKLCHFKELLAIDGYKKCVTPTDYYRRDSIATMLENWGLISILNRRYYKQSLAKIFVLKSIHKPQYEICHKYEFNA